jgi:signal recognition particle receptor subunit beta
VAEFDPRRRWLTLKLVYYGPALSGKTTNLMCLHDRLRPERKGEMMVLDTKNDRTLFFDLLPVGFTAPSGLVVRFKLFTVPGQVAHDSTRKAVLSRADGVVFVADSQRSQGVNNAESFQNLEDNARRVGLDFDTLPLVVQFNKRDLDDIYAEEEVMERWRETPWPVVFASALHGTGVFESLEALLGALYDHLAGTFALEEEHGLDRAGFIAAVVGPAVPGPAGEAAR